MGGAKEGAWSDDTSCVAGERKIRPAAANRGRRRKMAGRPYNPQVRKFRVYGDPHERLIDVERIDLDPVYDGFSGVVVEILREGDSYVVLQSAETTGNRLLRFVTASEERALAVFEGEMDAPDCG